MKKLYILAATLILLTTFTGCEKNDLPTYSGGIFAQFAETSGKFAVKENGEKVYEITVGTTLPATTDLTLTIDVDTDKSTAVEGRDFRLLTPVVTIPAGKMTATVQIEGIYANLPTEGVNLVLVVQAADGLINPNLGNSYTLVLSQLYDLSIEKLVGSYTQKGYDPDGKMMQSEVTIRKISDTEIEITNFGGYGTAVKATVNYDDATISILPGQALLKNFVGQDGTQFGDLTLLKVVLDGWNLVSYGANDPVKGECLSNGNIELESWALVSWSLTQFFDAYERTELIKK